MYCILKIKRCRTELRQTEGIAAFFSDLKLTPWHASGIVGRITYIIYCFFLVFFIFYCGAHVIEFAQVSCAQDKGQL